MNHKITLITALLIIAFLTASPNSIAGEFVQIDKPATAQMPMEKILTVDSTHLIVPISNVAKGPSSSILLGIYDGDKRVQDFTVGLPQGDEPFWLAAYPIETFALKGKQIKNISRGCE
jgi:hypothetical protein